jgi:hypothetical protein
MAFGIRVWGIDFDLPNLYQPDEDELIAWSGYVDVYFLAPVPPADEINYLIPTWLP